MLEHSPLPEVGTISGDIPEAPGILKGPAGPLARAPRLGSSGDFFGLFACGAIPRNRAHGTKRDAKTNAKRWFPCSRPRNRGHWAGNPLPFRKSVT